MKTNKSPYYAYLSEIIRELGENYIESDYSVLEGIFKRALKKALSISHRMETEDNILLLEDEIISYTKTIYLQRGSEDTKSLNVSGRSSQFIDADEVMRNSIIKGGKRLLA